MRNQRAVIVEVKAPTLQRPERREVLAFHLEFSTSADTHSFMTSTDERRQVMKEAEGVAVEQYRRHIQAWAEQQGRE